ncbi:MAG TPA: mitofilin family membrane protein [Stellaceae bacterium]|jgi:hypothetical protein|nr:mitofilin family membrane protein [Stellaceae bacterium]
MTEQHGDESGPGPAPGWTGAPPPTLDATAHDESAAAPAHGRRQLWPVFALVVLVVAILSTAPYWTQLLPGSAQKSFEAAKAERGEQDRRIAALTQQQAALEQRVAELEQQMKSVATPQWMQEQAQAMRSLADRIAALESHPPQAAADETQLTALAQSLQKLDGANAALGQRLDRLEQRGAAAADTRSDQALLLALGQLRAAVESGRPFTAELDTVKTLAHERPELTGALGTLGTSAGQGIANAASLAQRFRQDVAPSLLRAPAEPESDSLGARILGKLRSLVVIRRVGSGAAGSSDPVSAAVAKAETALGSDDLAGAVAALEDLPEQDRAPAQSWLNAAHRRLDAEAALDQATKNLTARLTAAPAPSAAEAAPQH